MGFLLPAAPFTPTLLQLQHGAFGQAQRVTGRLALQRGDELLTGGIQALAAPGSRPDYVSEDLRALLPHPLETFTPNTIADVGDLETELAVVREVGWASVREELEVGLNAVAAPIRDHTGNVVAAMSVSGPAYRLEPSRFELVAEMTIASAAAVSRRLGHVG